MKVKKYLFLLVLFFAAFIYSAILLIRLKLWYILIVSSIIFFGISFMALELGLLNMRGDWMGNVDLSLVDKTWIKIPSTATTNDFYWGATYKQKNESEVSKPYVILAHGIGSGLEELEIMAAPLALTVIMFGYNQKSWVWKSYDSWTVEITHFLCQIFMM